MKAKSIGILSSMAVAMIAAVAVLGGLASLSSAASGGPTVVLSSTVSSSTSATTIPVTATFSQAVNGLTSANITATNATVGTVSGSGTTFTFNVMPTASGTVTVMVGADVSSSTASSTGNVASNMLTFSYTPAATSTAFLALSSYSGEPGSMFNALGTNFNSSEQVDIMFGGATTTVSADASGNFTQSMTVPSLAVGPAAITATGRTSGLMASNSYYVQPVSSSTSTTTTSTSTTPLAVTGVDSVQTSATADGTFEHGWEWILHLVVPDTESNFAMKFGDFINTANSSTTFATANHIRIWSPQSSNASTTASSMLEANNDYSGNMMLVGDTSSTTPGRQIDVYIQAAVPSGTPTGNYTTTFGAMSTTTPF